MRAPARYADEWVKHSIRWQWMAGCGINQTSQAEYWTDAAGGGQDEIRAWKSLAVTKTQGSRAAHARGDHEEAQRDQPCEVNRNTQRNPWDVVPHDQNIEQPQYRSLSAITAFNSTGNQKKKVSEVQDGRALRTEETNWKGGRAWKKGVTPAEESANSSTAKGKAGSPSRNSLDQRYQN